MGVCVILRDRVEAALRSWNRYEIERGAPPVVDYDCYPVDAAGVDVAPSRPAVRRQLAELHSEATADPATSHIADRIGASLAYLDALLGAREPLAGYIAATQGCSARGWSDAYLDDVRTAALAELQTLGIAWDSSTSRSLKESEGAVAPADAADVSAPTASAGR